MQVAEAALLLISVGYRIILRLAAPIAFACAIFPGMSSAMSEWFAKYINYSLMPFVASIVGKIAFAFTFKYLYAYTQYFDSYGLKTGADNTDPTLMGIAFIGLLCCCLVLFFQVPSLTNMFVTAGGVGAMVAGATSLLDRGSQPIRSGAVTAGRGALLGGTMLAGGVINKVAGGIEGVSAWYGARKEAAREAGRTGAGGEPGSTSTKGAAKSVDINPNQISGMSGGSALTAKTPTKGLPMSKVGGTIDPNKKTEAEKILAGKGAVGKNVPGTGSAGLSGGLGGDSTRSGEGAPAKVGGGEQAGKGLSADGTTKTPGALGGGTGDSAGSKGVGIGSGASPMTNPDGTPVEGQKGTDKDGIKEGEALLVGGAAGAVIAGAKGATDSGTGDAKDAKDAKGKGTATAKGAGDSAAKSKLTGADTGGKTTSGTPAKTGDSTVGNPSIFSGGAGRSTAGADTGTDTKQPTIERNEEVYEASATMPSMATPASSGTGTDDSNYGEVEISAPSSGGSETGQRSNAASAQQPQQPEPQQAPMPSTAVGAFMRGFNQASFKDGALKGRDILVRTSRFNDAFQNFSRFDTSSERMERQEREQQRREDAIKRLQAANQQAASGGGSFSGDSGSSDSQGPVDSSPQAPVGGVPSSGGYAYSNYEDASMPQQPVSVGSSDSPNEIINRTIIVGPTNSSGSAMAPQQPIDVSSSSGSPSPRIRITQPQRSAPSGSAPVSYAGRSVVPAGSQPISNVSMPLGYNGLGYAMPVSSMARVDQERLFSSLEPQYDPSGGGSQPMQSRQETQEYHQEVVRELQQKYHVNPEPPQVSLAPVQSYSSSPEPSVVARQPQNPVPAQTFMPNSSAPVSVNRQGIVDSSKSSGQSGFMESVKRGAMMGGNMGMDFAIHASRASRGLQHFAYLDTSDEVMDRRRRQEEAKERRKNKNLKLGEESAESRMFNEPGDNDYARRERRYSDDK